MITAVAPRAAVPWRSDPSGWQALSSGVLTVAPCRACCVNLYVCMYKVSILGVFECFYNCITLLVFSCLFCFRFRIKVVPRCRMRDQYQAGPQVAVLSSTVELRHTHSSTQRNHLVRRSRLQNKYTVTVTVTVTCQPEVSERLQGLGLVVHIPSGCVAKINIPPGRERERDRQGLVRWCAHVCLHT
jgi:hypothetical protein